MSSSCHEMAFFTPNNFILHSPPDNHHHNPNSPLNPMLPSCAHQDNFPAAGVAAFLGKRTMSFEEMNGGEDEVLSDDGSQAGEKKRRLNMEQVKTLEKNFELGNKLEPERKMQLARALGLQPRQIAIWFQNRRARWKTKQLEKDYDLLKRQFDAIKADNDNLHAQNRKLQAEIMGLKSRDEAVELINLNKETAEAAAGSSSSNRSSENKRSELVMEMEINGKGNTEGGLCVESSNYPRSIALFPPAAGSCSSMRRHLFHTSSASLLVPNSNSNNNNINIDINNDDDDNNNNNIIISNNSNNNNNNNQMVMKEENLISNMFCGIEDQSGFWPWLEHQHFN